MAQNQEPKDVLEFAAALGVQLYDWQAKISITIEQAAALTRKKIAVRAPNGVGKTQRIIALSALRWVQRFPRGRVVVTSYDARQVSDQLWPALRAQAAKFHSGSGRTQSTQSTAKRVAGFAPLRLMTLAEQKAFTRTRIVRS